MSTGGSRSEAHEALARLRSEQPTFGAPDRPPSRVLEWLVGEIPLGGTSLEIGCGWSTIALGLVSDRHIAIAPDPDEHEALRRWAKVEDVALDGVELVVARSQDQLPAAALGEDDGTFDLVLVDGDHAAPTPALDVFLTTPLLRTGGLLAIERTRIRSIAAVVDRLARDTEGWSVRHRVDDGVVLQRRTAGPATRPPTQQQPGDDEIRTWEDRARALRARLRRR
jgi:predicted O-methyltransferase YrrM